ncbi:MAG: bacterial Ig-like domain-containing protein [Spirochaetaceae bacterium]|jgi:hypothetical protein|nr:bacterial Ig-like domain-containing protein [Spirochaetaceae bacterium]
MKTKKQMKNLHHGVPQSFDTKKLSSSVFPKPFSERPPSVVKFLILILALAFISCGGGNDSDTTKTVTSITITPPTKTTYNIGDTLDLTGIVVTATYSDSTTETVSVNAANVSGFDSSTAGSKTLTVTYQGKTATFTVTVQALKTVTFNSNGGSEVTSQTVAQGGKASKPADPEKAGYESV